MHYPSEVWIKDNKNVEDAVDEAMRPCYEGGNPDGFWDWYQIGGRWKGIHVPSYKPELDFANFEPGTNKVDWPTQWKPHPLDVMPVADLPATLNCYTLILPGKVLCKEKWDGKEWVKTDFNGSVLPALKSNNITDGYLVTVDYHD